MMHEHEAAVMSARHSLAHTLVSPLSARSRPMPARGRRCREATVEQGSLLAAFEYLTGATGVQK